MGRFLGCSPKKIHGIFGLVPAIPPPFEPFRPSGYSECMSDASKGCLGFLLSMFGSRPEVAASSSSMPTVQVNRYFVSNAEADFFRVLQRVVAGRAHVLAQVSLRQLVWFPGNGQSNRGRGVWQNKVATKSVDFVLCESATLRPLLAIELDEPSHAEPARQSRDADVEAVLDAAGLPLLRVLTSRNDDTRELNAAMRSRNSVLFAAKVPASISSSRRAMLLAGNLFSKMVKLLELSSNFISRAT